VKLLFTLVCALAIASPDAVARCAPRFERGLAKPQTITLTGPLPSVPAFYLRVFANPNRDVIVFFKPDDVVEALNELYKLAPTEAHNPVRGEQRNYLDAILGDLPLEEDTDLFKYTLRDRKNWVRQDALVQELLRTGRVAIRTDNAREDPKTITMVEQWPNADEHSAATRWFCLPDGLPLFEFWNEIAD